MYHRMLELRADIDAMTKEVGLLVKDHPARSRLTAIEATAESKVRKLFDATMRLETARR